MRRRLLLLLTLLPTLSFVVAQSSANAGADSLSVLTSDLNDNSVPRFGIEIDGTPCLSDLTVDVPGAPQVDVVPGDANSLTFTLPGAAAGEYLVNVSCTTDSGTETGTGFIDFGYVVVEKVVVGEAPPAVDFVIEVNCVNVLAPAAAPYGGESAPVGEGFGPPALQTKMLFGPGGGEETFVHYRAQTCDIEETETGGAQTVTVDTEDCEGDILSAPVEATSGTFDIGAATTCTQVVTNEFADAQVDPDDDTDDDVDPAVVVATPTFTG